MPSTRPAGLFTMLSSTLSLNSALRSGGALRSVSSRTVTLTGCDFDSNAALVLQGGAWSAEKEGNAFVSNCTFMRNQAPAGGAVTLYRDLRLTMTNASFSGNRAGHAGAMEASDCDRITITASS